MLQRNKKSYELQRSTDLIIHNDDKTAVSSKVTHSDIQRRCWTPFIGVFYTCMCSVAFLLSSVYVKKLSYIDPSQLSLVRNLCVLVGVLPIVIFNTNNIFGPKKQIWLLIVRSFVGATALYLNFMAYRLLPLTETSIILATVPALVTVAARLFLKEFCGLAQVVSIILTLFGVLLSVRLPEVIQNRTSASFSKDYIVGLSCAAGCALILTFTYVSLRKMANVHFSVVLLYYGILGSLENGVITYFTAKFEWPRCDGLDGFTVLMIGISGFIGNCLLILAVQNEAAGVVATVKSACDIVVAAMFQFIFFNSVPDLYTLTGGSLVIIAISYLGLWKWLKALPEDSAYKKKLKCLLF